MALSIQPRGLSSDGEHPAAGLGQPGSPSPDPRTVSPDIQAALNSRPAIWFPRDETAQFLGQHLKVAPCV